MHTHLRAEPLTRDDLVDLVRLRLDLVAAIQIAHGGEPRAIVYAHNVPADDGALPYREVGPHPHRRRRTSTSARLMGDLEAEFARRARAREVKAKDGRAILVHVGDKSKGAGAAHEAEESMRELRELARTAGTEVADCVVQMREHIDPKFVMGKGKLEEVVVRAMQLDAGVLVFDRELTPAQASAIAKHTDLKVIDRTQLILDIFAQRAEGRDGKLQVELAQLKYAMPRLAQKDDSLSRLTGGIGGRGPGETKLEIGRRRAKDRVTHLERQLKQLAKQREQRRRRRTRGGVPDGGHRRLHERRQEHAAQHADRRRRPRRGQALRHARHALAHAALRLGGLGRARGRPHRHRGLHPQPAEGPLRRLPRHVRGGGRRGSAAARGRRERSGDGGAHRAPCTKVLEDLELSEIPRLLVFNKIDLLEPRRAADARADAPRRGVRERDATARSTRPLIERIARELADKWERSAQGPERRAGGRASRGADAAATRADRRDDDPRRDAARRGQARRPRTVA